jgi:hypothetical protein
MVTVVVPTALMYSPLAALTVSVFDPVVLTLQA